MFKIPLSFKDMTVFSEHGWRFGQPKAFYITMDDKNAIYETYNIAIDFSDDESSDDDSSEDDSSFVTDSSSIETDSSSDDSNNFDKTLSFWRARENTK